MHLLVDSTELRLCGPGEWLVEKHGSRSRRSWKKPHLGVNADTGEIIATTLTSPDVDDGSQVAPLLDEVKCPVTFFTGDGAFDRNDVYNEIAACHPDTPVIVHRVRTRCWATRRRPYRSSGIDICASSPNMVG